MVGRGWHGAVSSSSYEQDKPGRQTGTTRMPKPAGQVGSFGVRGLGSRERASHRERMSIRSSAERLESDLYPAVWAELGS
jgi:hypothetical protein